MLLLIVAFSVQTLRAADSPEPAPGRWTSIGNGPSHSGYYPATLGNGRMTPGWSKSFGRGINPVAISEGRVFVTATGMPVREDTAKDGFVAALDSGSGQELWRRTVLPAADAPVVNGENLLVEAEPLWELYALRCDDGSVQWIHPFAGIIRTGLAPSVGDHLWLSFGVGKLLNLRISDNLLPSVTDFLRGTSPMYPSTSVRASYYAGILYATDGIYFNAVDPESGSILWSLQELFDSRFGGGGLPVLANGKASILAETSGLTTVDLATRSRLWTVSSIQFTGLPASDGYAVYALQRAGEALSLRAYRADTGTLLGQYELTDFSNSRERFDRPGQALVTNDVIFVATDHATYVFDKASFTLRTKLPVGGFLSFAAGTLYIADPDGNLLTYRFESAAPEGTPHPWPGPTPSLPLPQTDVEAVSLNRAGTVTGAGTSRPVALSATGRYVLFQSNASDISPLPDRNSSPDYFLRDRQTAATALITANGANTAAANFGEDRRAVVSKDGRFVIFLSGRYDLISPTLQDYALRVYIRDLKANKTTLIGNANNFFVSQDWRYVLLDNQGLASVYDLTNSQIVYQSDLKGGAANGISGDGRYIIFNAYGTQRTSTGSLALQCFVDDLVTHTTSLVTADYSGAGMANEHVFRARISADGHFVVFNSNATNLVSPPLEGRPGSRLAVYRRDMHTGVTECLTRGFLTATLADISDDGQVIVFIGAKDSASQGSPHLADLRADTIDQLPCGDQLVIDRTGRFIACEAGGAGIPAVLDNSTNIFLYDRTLRTKKLISHNLAGTSSPSGAASTPVLSEDGQTVAFASTASDLVLTPKYLYGPGATYFDTYVSSTARSGQLLNIATRGQVQPGDGALIGGFIIWGDGPKKVLLRALGPSLREHGVVGALPDPVLELHDSTGAVIGKNDNWTDEKAVIEAAGLPPSNSSEAALVRSLSPAAYTVVVRGASNSTGIGLVELYDLEPNASAKLANISTRGLVGSGDKVLIGGLIVGDGAGGSASVLVRAIGPSLTSSGISNALADPTLELYDSNGALVSANDNWKTAQAEIEATGVPPLNGAESALVATVPPGAYTAIVSSTTGTEGIGLVEVYRLH